LAYFFLLTHLATNFFRCRGAEWAETWCVYFV